MTGFVCPRCGLRVEMRDPKARAGHRCPKTGRWETFRPAKP